MQTRTTIRATALPAVLFLMLAGSVYTAVADTPPPIPTMEARERFIEGHSCGLEPPDILRTVHDEYDVTHYDVALDFDIPSQVITGTVAVQAQAQVANLGVIEIDLYDCMTVDGVTAGGSPAAYTHAGNLLTITLDGTYQPGEVFTIACDYHGTPSFSLNPFRWNSHAGVPMVLSYSEPYGAPAWWMCKDDPKDKATMAIHVTAPDTLYTVSCGRLDSIVDNGDGTSTFNWITDYPTSTYLFSIATTNFAGWTEIYTGLDSVTTMDVDYFAYPEDLADAQVSWSDNLEMMEFFAGLFGEYPFMDEKYAIAEFSHGGAMEHQTCTSMGAGWITGTHSNDFVVAHELSHSWVGDMITMREWSHAWCKEGFATHCEALYFEHKYGESYYRSYMNGMSVMNYAHLQLYDISNPLHAAIYYKGAWVLHMLRHVIGDEDFFNGVYEYTNDPSYRYSVANTDELCASFEAASGEELSWFFDQWIYSPGYPIFTEYWHGEPAGGGYDVHLNLVQVQSTGPIFKMPYDVFIMTAGGGQHRFTVWDSLYAQQFTFHVDGPPIITVLDPDNWAIFDITTTGLSSVAPSLIGGLAQNQPNPFNPFTTISFSLPRREHARLRVYDLSGRLVRELFDRVSGPGEQAVVWDGRGIDGTAMPSGVYFHRLDYGRQSHTGRMVLAR